MMVAGADLLCEYVAAKEGHPDCAIVDVTTGNHLLDGREPDIRMTRYRKDYGAHYTVTTAFGLPPLLELRGKTFEVDNAWICPVTLLVLFRYPKRINIYIKD